MTDALPIAIIGAGPVGLAAAAQLVERGLVPLLFEREPAVAGAMRAWGHVRLFSPWRYNLDTAARRLLEATGRQAPDLDAVPTGAEIVATCLEPLAAHPAIAPNLRLGARVTAIARQGLDKLGNRQRANTPFAIRWTDAEGVEQLSLARAVIDASGTWHQPNPMGTDGLPVPGERAASDRIAYGLPDIAGSARADYAGRRVLVVGSGHSAINNVLALLDLAEAAPGTQVLWALRSGSIDRLLGGGLNDQLPERGALGLRARAAIDAGRIDVLSPFAAQRIDPVDGALRITALLARQPFELTVDRIIVATGFRPDLVPLRELRVALDPAVEAPPALAPLIDPNFHSCGTVPPHGVEELSHPEPGFFIVGAKAYGRAPTFLMATGYEQVRSIADELAGDPVAARRVQLVLPETGVCSVDLGSSAAGGCCGGPATTVDACCVADEVAKTAGEAGCGCGTSMARAIPLEA